MSRRNGGIVGPVNTPVGGIVVGSASGVWRMNDVLTFVSNNQWPKGPENIENSCRFEDGNTDYLSGPNTTAGSTKTKFTFSAWIKRSFLGNADNTVIGKWSSGNDRGHINFSDTPDDSIQLFEKVSGSTTVHLLTNRLFRDTSAWYNIVYIGDTTESTSSDRLKLFVNGVQETSFSTATYPSQDYEWQLQAVAKNFGIGAFAAENAGASPSSFYLAEVVYLDGVAGSVSSFGETDSTTGIWKPKKIGAIANAGSNSFYLNFKDSSNLGKDESGLGNNFTVNNLTSVDQGTDTCVVNYATMNSVAVPPSNAPTFAEGNLKISTNNSNANPIISTMGVSQGKWYAEAKRISYDGGSGDDDGFRIGFGVTYDDNVNLVPAGIADSGHYFMIGTGTVYNGSTDLGDKAGDSNISDDGVVGIALDLDNNRISWAFNGAWMTGSNAWSGSSPSSYVTIESGKTYFFLQTDGSSGRAYTAGWNFGGQSAFTISSGNSDANGFGNFEYPVPSGYYALNTTNLNTYG